MSLSRRYGIINIAYHGSMTLDFVQCIYDFFKLFSLNLNTVAVHDNPASVKTEDTFINIPIYTESHNLSILGNLYRQTRHLLESVMIYR